MLTTTLLRRNALPTIRCATRRSLRSNICTVRPRTISQWLLRPTLQHHRLESTAAGQARYKTPPKYPEILTVYVAPYPQTITVGIVRVSCFVIVLWTTFLYAPLSIYASEVHSNWLIPAAILASCVPLTYSLLTGPVVMNIGVRLPSSARRSREALQRFSTNVPPTTHLRLKFLRFAPWGLSTEIPFSDLRRLPPTWTRLANLEYIPPRHIARAELETAGRVGTVGRGWPAAQNWFVRAYWGRYWVNMTSTLRDRSPVSGVWERMWEQIPWIGEGRAGREVGVVAKKQEKRPVSMVGRPVVEGRFKSRGASR